METTSVTSDAPRGSSIPRQLTDPAGTRGRDIVVIGASAGGVHALEKLINSLPADLPAAVFVLLHLPQGAPSVLPRILGRRSAIAVAQARDGEPIFPGRVYVAAPDQTHLVLDQTGVRRAFGPKENHSRPAVDVLFRSAARAFGPRVVGVVLSGTGADGTAGLAEIEARGGVTIVQDPDEAEYSAMPLRAIERVPVDHILPLSAIGPLLARLASEPVPELPPVEPTNADFPLDPQRLGLAPEAAPGDVMPHRVRLTCPECGLALSEARTGSLVTFFCPNGHRWTGASSLAAEQADELEERAWSAIAALEQRAALLRRVVADAEPSDNPELVECVHRAAAAEQQARRLRAVLPDVL